MSEPMSRAERDELRAYYMGPHTPDTSTVLDLLDALDASEAENERLHDDWQYDAAERDASTAKATARAEAADADLDDAVKHLNVVYTPNRRNEGSTMPTAAQTREARAFLARVRPDTEGEK